MVSEPGLAAGGFAADPVAHDVALVGVSLGLDHLPIHEFAGALAAVVVGGIGVYTLDAQVELRVLPGNCVRKMPERIAARRGALIGLTSSWASESAYSGEPLAYVRETIGKVEGAKASAGIVAAELFRCGDVLDAEEALEEAVNGDGYMALAAPDHGALKAHLYIHGWFERNLLHVYPGFVGVGMTLEAADEKFVAEGTE